MIFVPQQVANNMLVTVVIICLVLTPSCRGQHKAKDHGKYHRETEDNESETLRGMALVPLITFDNSPGTTFQFISENDPVMGGKSHSAFSIMHEDGHSDDNNDNDNSAKSSAKFARWDGEVAPIPKLSSPGFCSVKTAGQRYNKRTKFADVSNQTHLQLLVRSTTSNDYEEFKVSFTSCSARLPTFQFRSFKTSFTTPSSSSSSSSLYNRNVTGDASGRSELENQQAEDWHWVNIPFASFLNDWSPYTGNQNTQCKDDERVCPDQHDLKHIQQITIWAESIGSSKFNLDIMGVYAGSPADSNQHPPPTTIETRQRSSTLRTYSRMGKCSSSTIPQDDLRFNVSEFTATSAHLPFDPLDDVNESLTMAVCCDPIYKGYAEPRGFYDWPQVRFLDTVQQLVVERNGEPVTFYDSVCGIPVFVAPRGRSLEAFKYDTVDHGWPSFREEEVVKENIYLDNDGRIVRSKCGTRLGTLEPDADGRLRYCMDVSCIGGNPPDETLLGGDTVGDTSDDGFISSWRRIVAIILRFHQPIVAHVARF